MNQPTRRSPRWLQSDIFGTPDPRFLLPVSRLHQEMNRLFTDAFRDFDQDVGSREPGTRGDWTFNPVVDVEQQDKQYEISVELPGVRMNDINVEMKEDMLVISGSKERKTTTGQGDQQRSERIYGTFQRSFRLPEDAIREDINATFNDGVLTVSVPREESRVQAGARRIEVRSGAGGAAAKISASSGQDEREDVGQGTGRSTEQGGRGSGGEEARESRSQ